MECESCGITEEEYGQLVFNKEGERMCEDCMDKYQEHTNAREKQFRIDVINSVRKNLKKIEDKIENPYAYYKDKEKQDD